MNIKYNRVLDVAQGLSRRTKRWRNTQLQWSDLLDRLAETTRTRETVAEYKAMGRAQQADIKDVGGYVGGYCNEGNRSDIRHRSLLCLDADYADGDLWPDWLMVYDKAAAIYSTHKHTPDKQRLRLVIPLARDVDADEYQAIGRRVAHSLGIDKFDDTSYQPQRVMYWPSTPADGEFVFDYADRPMLDPDEVLATYHNWRDVSSWPLSSRQAEITRHASTKQQDPLTKGGLVGAFCRAYTIQEAIEEFIPAYAPCDDPGRYTYTEGSTAAGVVVYDDKFSYSHHGTDPASGQLCNAWDLVRLHKFAELDQNQDPDTPADKRKSYKAMCRYALSLDKVRAQAVGDRVAEAMADFADLDDEPETVSTDWMSKLQLTEKGTPAQTIENVVTILTHDPRLAGALAFNEMQQSIFKMSGTPWDMSKDPRGWADSDDAALRRYLERVYSISSRDKIHDGVENAAKDASFHPVRSYLDGCTWDGVPRVETLLIDYLGAEDTPYTRAVTRKTLAAAVARIYRPGCKFDYMLTLRGRQGVGKSTLVHLLARQWYSDSFTTMQGKEAFESIQGVWIMEVGELAGMRKAEAETIKLFISKQSDRFRPAYGRRIQEFPRQCIFIGTTNESQFLRDATGNRRFWVVDTPNEPARDLWDELTPEMVALIWGEAKQIYKAGETLYLSKELEAEARKIQEAYEEENPRAGIVADYLDRLLPEGWDDMDLYSRRQWLETDNEGTQRREYVCTLEVWAEALGGNPDRLDRYAGKEIREILEKMPEWRHMGNNRRLCRPYGRQRYYRRT